LHIHIKIKYAQISAEPEGKWSLLWVVWVERDAEYNAAK
jgi:hypothetical protein